MRGQRFETVLDEAQAGRLCRSGSDLRCGRYRFGAQVGHSGEPGLSEHRSISRICTPKGLPILRRIDIAYAREFGYTIKLLGHCEARRRRRRSPRASDDAAAPRLRSRKSRESTTRFNSSAMRSATWCSMAGAPGSCRPAVRWSAISSPSRAIFSRGQSGECRPPRSSRISVVRFGCGRWRKSARSTISALWCWIVPESCRRSQGNLGRCGISISSVLQQGRREGQTVPIVIKTHTATERDVQTALSEINRMAFISEPTTLIRVEGKDE